MDKKKLLLKNLKLPLILVCTITLALIIGDIIPIELKRFFLTISISLKNLILTFMPFVIFVFLSSSIAQIGSRALAFTLTLMLAIFVSNYISVLVGYGIGHITLTNLSAVHIDIHNTNALEPFNGFIFPLINPLRNEYALLLGLTFGVYIAIFRNNIIQKYINKAQAVFARMLVGFLIPLLPLFIFGYILKMHHEGYFNSVIIKYLYIVSIFIAAQLFYILTIYLMLSNFNLRLFWHRLRNMLPAVLTGFSTLSSAASMPVTLVCAEKNVSDPILTKAIIPATANIHIMGTAVGMNILILSAFMIFSNQLPALESYLIFAFFYSLTLFTVVAVPGGSIFALAPIMEHYLGATPEMITMITALNLILDPIDTSFNITGNGSFLILFKKLFGKRFLGNNHSIGAVTL